MTKTFILFSLIFSSRIIHGIELNQQDKIQLIENQSDEKTMIYKTLYTSQTKIENLENKIQSLTTILDQDINRKKYKNKKEIWKTLQRAKWHLLNGNTVTAIDIANSSLSNINIQDKKSKTLATKIIFEGNRILGHNSVTTEICSNLILNDQKNINFEDKWKLLCSLSFLRESGNNHEDIFKKQLMIWSLSPFSETSPKYNLLNKTIIAMAIRNLDYSSNQSLRYLENSLSDSKVSDQYLGKAYLIYSLFLYEKGNKDKSFEILKTIASKSIKNNPHLTYFEPDENTLLLAKLCYARLQTINGDLPSAIAWYENLLSAAEASSTNFLENEKKLAQLEYAKLLYRLKNYSKSSEILSKLIDSEEESNLQFNPFRLKISRLILANINSKNLKPESDGQNELIKLNKQAEVDLNYLENIEPNKLDKYDDFKKKVIPLAALCIEYGISGKESEYLVHNYLNLEWTQKNQEINRIQLTNALNSVDQIKDGITHANSLTAIKLVQNNFEMIENLIKTLDHISFPFWDENAKGYSIALSERLELLRSTQALHDIITKNELRLQNKKIYQSQIIDNTKEFNKNLRHLKAQIANINYLEGNNKFPKKDFQYIEDQLQEMTLNYRKSLLRNEIFPSTFYALNKSFDQFDYATKRLYYLHKSQIKDEFLNRIWVSLIEVNNKNNNLLNLISKKLNKDRKSILARTDKILNEIKYSESAAEEIKIKSTEELESLLTPLIVQLKNRIKIFQDRVSFSLADQNRFTIQNSKNQIIDEENIKRQRESWYQTLQKSAERGLFR